MTILLEHDGNLRGPRDLGSQAFTASWVNVGTVFKLGGAEKLFAFVDVTANDSLNMQTRVVGRLTQSGNDYTMPIEDVGTSSVSIESETKILKNNIDQRQVIEFEVGGGYPYGLVQIKAGTLGGTAAVLNACNITTSGE